MFFSSKSYMYTFYPKYQMYSQIDCLTYSQPFVNASRVQNIALTCSSMTTGTHTGPFNYYSKQVDDQRGAFLTLIPMPICTTNVSAFSPNSVLMRLPETFFQLRQTSLIHLHLGLSLNFQYIIRHTLIETAIERRGIWEVGSSPRMVMYTFPGGLDQVFVFWPCPCVWELATKANNTLAPSRSLGQACDRIMVEGTWSKQRKCKVLPAMVHVSTFSNEDVSNSLISQLAIAANLYQLATLVCLAASMSKLIILNEVKPSNNFYLGLVQLLNKMPDLEGGPTQLVVEVVREFRDLFNREGDYLAKAVETNNQAGNETLLELHFLTNDLKRFFGESMEVRPKDHPSQVLAGTMSIIQQGRSERDTSSISSSQARQRTSVVTRLGSTLSDPFSSPENQAKVQTDHLHGQDGRVQSPQSASDALYFRQLSRDYQMALQTINSLTTERSELQQIARASSLRLEGLEREMEELVVEKKYCLNLLVKHSEKTDTMEMENRKLKQSLAQFEQKYQELSCDVVQKSELLQQIREFLRREDTECDIKVGFQRKSYNSEQPNEHGSQKLVADLVRLSEQVEFLTEENNNFRQRQREMESDMELLLRDNEQFYKVIEGLKAQIKNTKGKSKEGLLIEEGKRLNEMVHRQNRNLLQANYELSNQIHDLEQLNSSLKVKNQKLEVSVVNVHKRSQNVTLQDTMNFTPKTKFSLKNNFDKTNLLPQAGNTNFWENHLRMEKQKNRQLESKVEELLSQVAAYEEELEAARNQMNRLGASIIRDSLDEDQIKNLMVDQHRQAGIIVGSRNRDSVNLEPEFMTLGEFTQRFQPSLMDILFIMLRITQLSQSMLETGEVMELSPSNALVVLDDPDHPENIVVKIVDNQYQPDSQTYMFEAPEIVTNQVQSHTQASVVWNIGMVFYYLVHKRAYFQTFQSFLDNENGVHIAKDKFPEAQTVIESMLQRSPRDRISIKDVLQEIAYEINKMLEEEHQN